MIKKKQECKLCGWKGRTHLHHIIPLREQGSNNDKNLIELCPNHHSESVQREKEFAYQHNLIGEKLENEFLEAMDAASQLLIRSAWENLSRKDLLTLSKLILKHGFDKEQLLANSLGITKKSFIERYGEVE